MTSGAAPLRAPVVAYLPTRYPVLSETFVRAEVREMRRQGATVHVLIAREATDPALVDEPYEHLLEHGATRRQLGLAHVRVAARRPLGYLRAWRVVQRSGADRSEVCWRQLPWWALRLRERGTTSLQAHFAWSSATRARVLSLLTGLPWVLTVHGLDVFGRVVGLADKVSSADAVVSVCDYMARHISGLGVELRRPTPVVVCGVVVPPEPAPGPAAFDVIAVGRLVEKKAFDVLLRACVELGKVRPGTRVVIVGDGPLREQLTGLRDELGLHEVVELRGAVAHEETLDLIGKAAVLALPARIAADGDRDSMPVVGKEALARAIPVVGTDLVGIPEMVDDSCGWLVPADDPHALAEALAAALTDPAAARSRGLAGRARVDARFRLDTNVAILRELHCDLADLARVDAA